jgi:dTDP-4-dehydrorhamnose reductase
MGKAVIKKILIVGATGLLGNTVGKYFINTSHDVTLTYRKEKLIYGDENNWIQFQVGDELDFIKDYDYVINCIGIIKPYMSNDENPIDSRMVNSVFPWQLSHKCEELGCRLIHITTDCVFSGRDGKYNEESEHDALDAYGKTKSLGEPVTKSMVLRTSIIGEEIHSNASLIEWAKSQKGKEVNGFTHHLWNGVTTRQYARCCAKIINNDLYSVGLFHIFSENTVSKAEMLGYFNDRYGLNLSIKETNSIGDKCDRSLSTLKCLNGLLDIPTVKEQIMEL